MGTKLYRFMTPLAALAILFACGCWPDSASGSAALDGGKDRLVLVLIGYHVWCGKLLRDFRQGSNRHSHIWLRWFNEVPVSYCWQCILWWSSRFEHEESERWTRSSTTTSLPTHRTRTWAIAALARSRARRVPRSVYGRRRRQDIPLSGGLRLQNARHNAKPIGWLS